MGELSLEKMEAVARSYQKLLVLAMFGACADRVLDVADPRPGENVLDVACGTGVLARAAAEHVGDDGSVIGLDMNAGMLSVAEDLAPGLEWREGQAEELPFDAETFDVVTCQVSLMFFDDQKAAIREMLRVLKPDGRLVMTVFDSLATVPPYESLIGIYDAVSGGEIGPSLRAPFSMSDTGHLRALFAECGVSSPHVSTWELEAKFPSVRKLVLADVEGWFPLAGIELDDGQVEEVVRRTRSVLENVYVGDDGCVTFGMPVHFVTNVDDMR